MTRLKFNKEKIYSIKKDLDYITSTISTALDINSDIGTGNSIFEIIFEVSIQGAEAIAASRKGVVLALSFCRTEN